MAQTFNFRPAGFNDFDEDLDDAGFVFGGEEFDSDDDAPRLSTPTASQNASVSSSTNLKSRGGFGQPPQKLASNGWMPRPDAIPKDDHKTPPRHSKKVIHRNKNKMATAKDEKEPGKGSSGGIPEVIAIDDFRMAVIRNDLNLVKKFLDDGVEVDTVFGGTGWTALMYAASCAHCDILTTLLEQGADCNFHKDLYTVLMAACASTRDTEVTTLKCVDLLLEKGVDVNAFDRYHMSPLMYASREGRASVVQRLIEKEARLDKQDNKGYTALMWGVTRGHLRVVQTLLAGGADAYKKSSDGSTAFDLAVLRGQSQIQEILQKYSDPSQKELLVSASALSANGPPELDPYPQDAPPEPKSKTSALISTATQGYVKYGELELFLTGLELGNFIPTFQEHHMGFTDFLRMTDKDLQQMGITQLGIRKKILDAIRQTHKREWETSSLSPLQYNKQISCAESVAMVTNIKKHASYISSTIGYISDQIRADDSIVSNAQDGVGAGELCIQTEETMTNIRLLYHELVLLRTHLSEFSDNGVYKPPDLVPGKAKRTRKRTLPLVASGLLVFGIFIWKGEAIIGTIANVFKKFRTTS